MSFNYGDDNIDRQCAAMEARMSNLSVTKEFSNVDKTFDNMQPITVSGSSDPQPTPVFHSRAADLQKRVKRRNRNLFLILFCFILTCGFCCGQCLPSD